MEGSVAIAGVAQRNVDQLGLQNVQLIRGNFDETLVSVIQTQLQLDFVYIDGNHRKEPTLRYFDQLLCLFQPQSVLFLMIFIGAGRWKKHGKPLKHIHLLRLR